MAAPMMGRPFLFYQLEPLAKVVILVKTGIQFFDEPRNPLDSHLRGNDGYWRLKSFAKASLVNE
ncbi:MAG: hypothetical protein DRH06_08055 [Deltaproteobacteria bacterium]|nr:MAG: hypothetical protein DRH06_08055 [Deltaproteobacteria bacterium]